MKKVPHWISKVLKASQLVTEADERNALIEELISGSFDYIKFDKWCRRTYNYETEDGSLGCVDNFYDAVDMSYKGYEPHNIQFLLNQEGF